MSCVLAAVDLSPSSARVLRHAAGFARMWSLPLRVLHVSTDPVAEARKRVLDFYRTEGPYEVDLADEEDIIVRAGLVSESIHREAAKQEARLIVVGARHHGGVTRWLLGSTSEAVLRSAPAPVLIVPPVDLDIVNITDRATLTCGPVLVAIDLTEHNSEQLRVAGDLAHLAGQPLLLMTVSPRAITDHAAGAMLRERAHDGSAVKPRAMIVRRGNIAEEISRCAVTENAGLVVMGLRARHRPGGSGAVKEATMTPTWRTVTLTMVAALLIAPAIHAQAPPESSAALMQFQRAADAYAFQHRQVQRRTGDAPEQPAMAAAMRTARTGVAEGALFTPVAGAAFRAKIAAAIRDGGCKRPVVADFVVPRPNEDASRAQPLAACLVTALPRLPEELEYRTAGVALLLVDVHASLVVDVLHGAFPGVPR